MNLYEQVYEIVSKIPKGYVMSYGQIATVLGNKRLSRRVGQALHSNPKPGVIPCHRVVFKDGSLASSFAFGGIETQRMMLLNEGIKFDADGKVLKECFIVFNN